MWGGKLMEISLIAKIIIIALTIILLLMFLSNIDLISAIKQVF